MKTVGMQGAHGTFSEMAVYQYFGKDGIAAKGYRNFVEIMQDLENHAIDDAVLPVENTTTGIIARTYDLFKYYHVHAVGEVLVPIVQDLITLPGASLSDIKEVYSHPEALSQCQGFFEAHPDIRSVPYQDTAKSVEYIKACKDISKAAIGSSAASAYYHLPALCHAIQDSKTNTTRFLVVTWKDDIPADANKTSLMLVINHEPGSLYRALASLADKQINMVKLESRPIPGKMFEYLFYVDIMGTPADPVVKEALAQMKKYCVELRSFGSYRAASL
ncbi:prephenate dehydratase [Stecheria sp. CLA-KB-P133]|uniref:Prephenate dehydratase n=1 Tax=Grylomicrobium aquisgranensis TaxID=2926318 RepID=A0AB35TZG7_9FIRM|nr:prephenate dehydratase [Lactimicrobium massiliense]MDX8418490.1 prephenate dehydratase [Stecheria sp. CLA-KB-P133]